MAARGHLPPPFEGRSIQAPGMLRHGPFPAPGPAGHHPMEPMPPVEFLEKKIAGQAGEMDRIANENRRLAETHMVLRQHLGATQHEMQKIQADISRIHTESDMQVRGLTEKIGKMETDIHASEMLRKELQQAHMEAQSLLAARQELTAELQHAAEELQKASADRKILPDMHAEVEALRLEHQKLRAAFEYEKGLNMDQVERMQAMDKNLISLAKEVEKLQADVANVEKKASAPRSYATNMYGSPGSSYPQPGQAGGYADRAYAQGGAYHDTGYASGAYAESGFGQGGPASYGGAYGRPQAQAQAQAAGGAVPEGMHSYGGLSSGGYPDGYARLPSQAAGSVVDPYGGGAGASYGSARGPATSAQR